MTACDRSAATGRIVETSSRRPVDDALRQPEENTKLNRRSLRLPHSTITLRESLKTLEHAAVTFRVFARSLVDSTRLAGGVTWPRCTMIRIGSASYLASTRRPGRSGVRYGAS